MPEVRSQRSEVIRYAPQAAVVQPSPYVAALDVAELLGVDEKTIRRRCYADEYDHRYTAVPGTGGRRLEVAMSALPADVQVRALARFAPEVRGQGSVVSVLPLP